MPAPREALLAQAEVLGDRQDRVGEAALQRAFVRVAHVVRLVPVEALVEVNVRRRPIAHRQAAQRDVHVHQTDVNADPCRELLARKRFVWRNDILPRHMPR